MLQEATKNQEQQEPKSEKQSTEQKQSLLTALNYRHQMFTDKFSDICFRLNELSAELGGAYVYSKPEDEQPTEVKQSQISIYEHLLIRNEITLAKIYKITERLEHCIKF